MDEFIKFFSGDKEATQKIVASTMSRKKKKRMKRKEKIKEIKGAKKLMGEEYNLNPTEKDVVPHIVSVEPTKEEKKEKKEEKSVPVVDGKFSWDEVQDENFSILNQLDIDDQPLEFKTKEQKDVKLDTDWGSKPYVRYIKWSYPQTKISSDPTFVSFYAKQNVKEDARKNREKFLKDLLSRSIKKAKKMTKKLQKDHKTDGFLKLKLKRRKMK